MRVLGRILGRILMCLIGAWLLYCGVGAFLYSLEQRVERSPSGKLAIYCDNQRAAVDEAGFRLQLFSNAEVVVALDAGEIRSCRWEGDSRVVVEISRNAKRWISEKEIKYGADRIAVTVVRTRD